MTPRTIAYLLILLIVLVGMSVFLTPPVFGYELLESIGRVSTVEDNNYGSYLETIYELGIGIAGVLAVLMIVIGGLQYIGSAANPSAKEAAKKRIWNAILGLLLAVASYIILVTINPDLVKFNLNLTKAQTNNQNQPSQSNFQFGPAHTTSGSSGGSVRSVLTAGEYCFSFSKAGSPTKLQCNLLLDRCINLSEQMAKGGFDIVTTCHLKNSTPPPTQKAPTEEWCFVYEFTGGDPAFSGVQPPACFTDIAECINRSSERVQSGDITLLSACAKK